MSASITNAAFASRVEMVQLLLAHGANVNARDSYGRTPLMCACGAEAYGTERRRKRERVIRLLISRGAEIDAKDKFGHTALSDAVWDSDMGLVKLLISLGAKE